MCIRDRQASDLYELGSVQLRKRLYPQAAATLKQALKRLSGEPDEARALIETRSALLWQHKRITPVPPSTTSLL